MKEMHTPSKNVNIPTWVDDEDDVNEVEPEKKQRRVVQEVPYQESDFERIMGERYDELLEEREKLGKKIEAFEHMPRGYFSANNLTEQDCLEIAKEWQATCPEARSFLGSLQELGLDFFKKNPKKQPGFAETEINYVSRENEYGEQVYRGGGSSSVKFNRVTIHERKTSVKERLEEFLLFDRFSSDSQVLLHEMIHRYHLNENPATDSILTEAQAYLAEFVANKKTSITETAEMLVDTEGVYKYNHDATIEVLTMVETLYALGKSDKEIADIIHSSSIEGQEIENYRAWIQQVRSILEPTLKEMHVTDEIDEGALHDIYRLHINNERMKARLSLGEIMGKKLKERADPHMELRKELHAVIPRKGATIEGEPISNDAHFVMVFPRTPENDYDYNDAQHYRGVFFGKNTDTHGMPQLDMGIVEENDGKQIFTKYDNFDERMLKDIERLQEVLPFDVRYRVWKDFTPYVLDYTKEKKPDWYDEVRRGKEYSESNNMNARYWIGAFFSPEETREIIKRGLAEIEEEYTRVVTDAKQVDGAESSLPLVQEKMAVMVSKKKKEEELRKKVDVIFLTKYRASKEKESDDD